MDHDQLALKVRSPASQMVKKSSKTPPKGKLSEDLLLELCVGIVGLAEEGLGRQETWEGWARQSVEIWAKAYQENLTNGETVRQARHLASDQTKQTLAGIMQEWATSWYGGKAELMLGSLPTSELFASTATAALEAQSRTVTKPEDLARELLRFGDGMATIDRIRNENGKFAGTEELRFPPTMPETDRIQGTLAAAAAWALLKGASTMNAALEANRIGPSQTEPARQAAGAAFVADAVKSLEYVRGVIVASAVRVTQQAAAGRARVLADTVSRRLGLDAASGRLDVAVSLVRKPRSAPSEDPSAAAEAAGFWREIERDTRKALTRGDFLRLARA